MLRKHFGANGVGLCVKRRPDVLYVQHLIDWAIKLVVTVHETHLIGLWHVQLRAGEMVGEIIEAIINQQIL